MVRKLAVAGVLVSGAAFIALLATTKPPVAAKKPEVVAPPPTREALLRDEPVPLALRPLLSTARPKLPSGEGDWLTEHPEEGQSLAEHAADCVPVPGKVIYLVPAGELDAAGAAVVAKLAPLLAAHFQLEVKTLAALPSTTAGRHERARDFGKQWLTKDVLEALLSVKPDDAAAVMAVSQVDLYPDPTWNFVFGEASYEQRVGVMSLARTGELAHEPTLVLTRAYATGMHEIGHMLQLLHCVAWECPMNGSNHQEEADTRPLEPCPHCLAKLMRATGLEPTRRWRELGEAFRDAGITRGVEEIAREVSAVETAGDR